MRNLFKESLDYIFIKYLLLEAGIWGLILLSYWAPRIFSDPWSNSTIVTKLCTKTVIYY